MSRKGKALSTPPAMKMPTAGPSEGYTSYTVMGDGFVIFEYSSLDDMRSGGIRARTEVTTQTTIVAGVGMSTQTETASKATKEIDTQTTHATIRQKSKRLLFFTWANNCITL